MIRRPLAVVPVRPVREFDREDSEKNRRHERAESQVTLGIRTLDANKVDRAQVGDVVTGDYSASFGELVKVDPSGGALSITLPKVSGGDRGRLVWVKNVTSSPNAIKLTPVRPSRIDTGTVATIAAAGESMTLVADGVDWWVI